jgi:hypothetical protein
MDPSAHSAASPRRYTKSLVLVLGAVTVALSGCSGSSSPVPTVTVTASATGAPEATETPATPESIATYTSETPGSETTEPTASTTGPPVLRNAGAPKSLTLTDIFEHQYWEEGLYQTPQSATPQQAMGTELDCKGRSLEVRLAQATGMATIKVAQALDSRSSKVTMEFKLYADQRLVDTKLVKFNQLSTLTAKLDGVSALELDVRRAQGSEACHATAVITEFQLTPR